MAHKEDSDSGQTCDDTSNDAGSDRANFIRDLHDFLVSKGYQRLRSEEMAAEDESTTDNELSPDWSQGVPPTLLYKDPSSGLVLLKTIGQNSVVVARFRDHETLAVKIDTSARISSEFLSTDNVVTDLEQLWQRLESANQLKGFGIPADEEETCSEPLTTSTQSQTDSARDTLTKFLNAIEGENSDLLTKIAPFVSDNKKIRRLKRRYSIPPTSQYVALDCEFVGVDPRNTSALARCSVVDFDGNVIIDIYSKPDQLVTHYRSKSSGIHRGDLEGAMPFQAARQMVVEAVEDRIVVGHDMRNDLGVLKITLPDEVKRDTSDYVPLRTKAGLPVNSRPSLRNLSAKLLNKTIQAKEHCSVEDAKATMEIYRSVRDDWEAELLIESEKRARLSTDGSFESDDSTDDEAVVTSHITLPKDPDV